MTAQVDIVIPVYNDQKGIITLLKSIENQNIEKSLIRVLVVDNNSLPAIKLPLLVSRSILCTANKLDHTQLVIQL